ncbi:unnamed protein product [Candida verbasci]|uniref:ATP-dependent 6-phosphofructokinase n=1 Tax=Candida verbasci TaxID=1227364 RepID=A0A9W4TYF0_9ASCO|nr:unnamed protein product [Candida verbasci]
MLLIWFLLIGLCISLSDSDTEEEVEIVRCNPLKNPTCHVANEALRSSIFETFYHGTKYFSIASCRKGVNFSPNGLSLTIAKEYDNPVLVSSFYLMYGKVEAEIKGSNGQGIISSFYLQSDDLDEIDICEIFGSDQYEFQTNYFIKGNISDYERGRYHHLSNNPLDEYNKYGIEWTPDYIIWYLNNKIVRKLGNKNKYGFPTSPMLVKFSLWSGGDDTNSFGTVAWAGGETNYKMGPFVMNIKNLKAINYSNGDSYNYGWLPNGEWQELKALGGNIYGDNEIEIRKKFKPVRKPTLQVEEGEEVQEEVEEDKKNIPTIIKDKIKKFKLLESGSDIVVPQNDQDETDNEEVELISGKEDDEQNRPRSEESIFNEFRQFSTEYDKELERISFISLITNSSDKFLQTYSFYNKLGFRLTKNFSRISNDGASAANNPQLHLGISKNSLREVWLESYPLQNLDSNGNLKPWQELEIYNGDNCEKLTESTVIKIRYSNEKLPISHYDLSKKLIFFTTNLKKIENLLEEDCYEYLNDDIIISQDPLGNSLKFTNSKNVLEKIKYHSAEEYIEKTSKEILEKEQNKQRVVKSQVQTVIEEKKDKKIDGTNKKKKIAVMTSGGDAPGMNPAVRAVVRAGIYYGCDVFAVYEGYEGLVKGGKLLKKIDWEDVRSYLSLGGTAIGTARCKEFREREGRLMGAFNMIKNGIDALVVCGGDGSLTGADLFRSEWPSLVKELVDTNKFTAEEVKPYQHLTIVGLVGSIDNDMSGTDVTIGAYSALERITEMVDYIGATASSHSRAFVVEVMGRHCGWLALMSGIATGADYIFIPERPPKANEWKNELKEIVSRHRGYGRRKTTVIVAEGAIDDELNPISSDEVKNVLVDLGLDTRTTILGHVQRGGTAVAFDRKLATMQGVEAVKAVLSLTPETPSPMIGILKNKIVRYPLVDAVKQTKAVATNIENKDFDKAMSLRDANFYDAYKYYKSISYYDDGSKSVIKERQLSIAVVHVGAASAGLNAATRAAVLYSISRGHKLFAVMDGFSGLIAGKIKPLTWIDVEGWHNKGGSEIGTNRSLPSVNFGKIAYHLQNKGIQGLIIIGGFEAFTSLHELYEQKSNYPIFEIPMVVIPATVSNNVPGSEYSLGSDTCLNELVTYCDVVQQSASSSRRRVFVVEVQGGHSGYVASYCGLITGSIATYTPEAKINLIELQRDIELLFKVFQSDRGEDHSGKLIIRNEQASSVYSTELIADIIKENAKGRFETRTAIPGHVQQGFTPTGNDRVMAVKFTLKALEFIEEWNRCHDKQQMVIDDVDFEKHSQVVIGIHGDTCEFTSVRHLYESEANVELRKGKTIHWLDMIEVEDMLSGKSLLIKQEKDY